MADVIAHQRDGVSVYATELYTGKTVTVDRIYRGGNFREIFSARCNLCEWGRGEYGLYRDRADANAAYMEHMDTEHADSKKKRRKLEYRVAGHCIRCAGAQYTQPVERYLRPDGPDEPVSTVADGFDGERLPWHKGYIEFETGPQREWKCPRHKEPLRFVEAVLLRVDGYPAQFMTAALDDVVIDSAARIERNDRAEAHKEEA